MIYLVTTQKNLTFRISRIGFNLYFYYICYIINNYGVQNKKRKY